MSSMNNECIKLVAELRSAGWGRAARVLIERCTEVDRLRESVDRSKEHLEDADRLAFEVATAIRGGKIATRSRIDDALLDYLEIGAPGRPLDVPAWCDKHEEAQAERRGCGLNK